MKQTPPLTLNADKPLITFDLPESLAAIEQIHAHLVGLPLVTGVTRSGEDQRLHVTLAASIPLGIAREIVRRVRSQ